MIDRRPALIARCAGVADVLAALDFARARDLPFTVRGRGHNIARSSLCDDGLLIDLSGMKSVHIDPVARRALVEPGATLGDFDHEAQAFGLATPLGPNSTTGVAGLTLGGGIGWLNRTLGMTSIIWGWPTSSSPMAACCMSAAPSIPTCSAPCAAAAEISAS